MPYSRGPSGVYIIRNLLDGKVYIGGSTGTKRRMFDHKEKLNKGNHRNPNLQAAWIKDGPSNFDFKILVTCPIDQIKEMESKLILEYKSLEREFGYNVVTNNGIPGYEQTEEYKRMRSKVGAQNHGNYDYIIATKPDGTKQQFDLLLDAGEYINSLNITKSTPYTIRMGISRAARGLDPKSPVAYNHTWEYIKH